MEKDSKKWWQTAVIYQIYPRSFYDSNGDGIGDLKGILEKLDYLQILGIDAIWLSPVYQSPQDDNGYDISDFQKIDPMFGTMTDMDALIAQARERGIRIILDLPLTHTSDEHPWFQEAKKSRDNPYHDYYIWADGDEEGRCQPPYAGAEWEWEPACGQYYQHHFSSKEPDLNWGNPSVRMEIYRIIQWWISRGVEGFRMDIFHQSQDETGTSEPLRKTMADTYAEEMQKAVFQGKNLVTVGETRDVVPAGTMFYDGADGGAFSMVFQFGHLGLDQQDGKEKWDLAPLPLVKFKKIFTRWQKELYGKGWNSLFLENHDLPRSVSRFCDDGKYRMKAAKMLGTLLFGMQGTPFLYQGEELGMANVKFDIEEYRDQELLHMYHSRMEQGYDELEVMRSIHEKGRDNARTPMQWDDSPHAGFTTGTPWLRCNPDYTMVNAAEELVNQDSVFHYYRKLIRLRKTENIFTEGSYGPLWEDDDNIFAYVRESGREKLLVLCNFRDREIPCSAEEEWEEGEVLITNYDGHREKGILRPYEAMIIKKRKEDFHA